MVTVEAVSPQGLGPFCLVRWPCAPKICPPRSHTDAPLGATPDGSSSEDLVLTPDLISSSEPQLSLAAFIMGNA